MDAVEIRSERVVWEAEYNDATYGTTRVGCTRRKKMKHGRKGHCRFLEVRAVRKFVIVRAGPQIAQRLSSSPKPDGGDVAEDNNHKACEPPRT